MQALRREGRRSLWSRRAENSRPSRPAHVTGQRVRGSFAANLGGTTEHASSYTDGVLFCLPVFRGQRDTCGYAPQAHKREKPMVSPSCESPPSFRARFARKSVFCQTASTHLTGETRRDICHPRAAAVLQKNVNSIQKEIDP